MVFGILKEDKTLDLNRISILVALSKPLKVVIHKAIDETPGRRNITILSSGGKSIAKEGN